MHHRASLIAAALGYLCICQILSAADDAPVVGPASGALVIAGGGVRSDTIVDTFIELAGGANSAMVVVPTAGGRDRYDEREANFLRRRGATHVVVFHTSDRDEANSDEFIEPLLQANAVWFGGGRQWRLVDAYAGTKVEQLFRKVLERGGVIGGSSAGATIQGSYLVRGDTRNNQIMMGDHEQGFGFLKNVAIDQHVLARNRHFDLFEILRKKPNLLGIGVDEDTAIVVRGDQFQVIGANYAVVYDGNFWSREGSALKSVPSKDTRFYFLRSGDRYNLRQRKVLQERR